MTGDVLPFVARFPDGRRRPSYYGPRICVAICLLVQLALIAAVVVWG